MVAAQDLLCALAQFLLSAERTPFQFEVRRVLSLKRVTGNLTNTVPRSPRRDTPRRERLTWTQREYAHCECCGRDAVSSRYNHVDVCRYVTISPFPVPSCDYATRNSSTSQQKPHLRV